MIDLNTFQLLALVLLGLLLSGAIFGVRRRALTAKEGVVWGSLVLAAAVVVLRPGITVSIAKALGIGRGADLVFYTAVAAMMVGFWKTYMNLRAHRRELTVLVRHIALLEANLEKTQRD